MPNTFRMGSVDSDETLVSAKEILLELPSSSTKAIVYDP
jgi:hypothetical protein